MTFELDFGHYETNDGFHPYDILFLFMADTNFRLCNTDAAYHILALYLFFLASTVISPRRTYALYGGNYGGTLLFAWKLSLYVARNLVVQKRCFYSRCSYQSCNSITSLFSFLIHKHIFSFRYKAH